MQRLPDLMKEAVFSAERFNHSVLTVEHVWHILLSDDSILGILTDLGADTDLLYRALLLFLEDNKTNGSFYRDMIQPDDLLQRLVATTIGRAVGTISLSNATALDLFLNILKLPVDSCFTAHTLSRSGITLENTSLYLSERQLDEFARSEINPPPPVEEKKEVEDNKSNNSAFKTIEEAEEFILKFATNLNKEAQQGKIDPLIGRDAEVTKTIQVLMRRRKNNPLLIGEAGVGKTSIAEGIANRIVLGEVPSAFSSKVIYNVDVGALIAGTRYRGDFEDRMRNLVQAFSMMPDAIMFLDEIHLIVEGGKVSSGSVDASNLLKPALAKGQIRCIGATTYEDYRKGMERDKALSRRFKQIVVDQPTPEQAKAIIMGLRPQYELHHGVTYTVCAVDAAVDLVMKYFRNATLPDRAIDLIDDAGARQAIADQRIAIIDRSAIEAEVAAITHIPLQTIRASEHEAVITLAQVVKSRVFGQDHAIDMVSDVVKIARAGLRPENKPEAMFLFEGPTGVGKTELARGLADTLGSTLVKYDMSEFMDRHNIARLIGSPPGYVGHGDGGAGSGMLINDIEQNPRCVLLLDEVEKAHPDIFNILLQVMDDACLTSASGKMVDFRNVIIIMTTNAGATDRNKASIGFSSNDNGTSRQNMALKKFFKPEFLNRLDGIIPFSALSIGHLERVTEKFLRDIVDRLAQRDITLRYDPSVITFITKQAHDPSMGARPIARAIDRLVRLPLSNLLLNEGVREGWEVDILEPGTDDELTISAYNPHRYGLLSSLAEL